MRLLTLLILSAPLAMSAQDTPLESIRMLLEPMRRAVPALSARGATPAMTQVKHLLRDWIESRFAELVWNGTEWRPNPAVFQEQLNDELSHAGLFCGARSKVPCPEWSGLGFLDPITVERTNGALVVRTSVGIQECGVDQSAYAYEYDDAQKQWRRFWQTEQDDYSKGKYLPERLERVVISAPGYLPGQDRSAHLILTLGTEPWCSSVWHPVYYRVWQSRSSLPEPKLLLDGKEVADIANPIHGAASYSDVLFEYMVIGSQAERDPEVRHYVVEQDKLVRRDPIATSPRNFVAAWLGAPWPESSQWTEAASRSKLEQWRRQNKTDPTVMEAQTQHCKQRPDLWQVKTFDEIPGSSNVYFLVRWRPAYHFTMVSASRVPDTDCQEEDAAAENPLPLFPDQ